MEPIDSLVTDNWSKEYDSLFDMFDEEMRGGVEAAAALDEAAAATSTWPTSMSSNIGIHNSYEATTYYAAMAPPATPLSDYYYTAATFAATTPSAQAPTTSNYYCRAPDTAYDLNNQYYSNQYHQHVVNPSATCASGASTPANATASSMITTTTSATTTTTTTTSTPLAAAVETIAPVVTSKQPTTTTTTATQQSGLIQPPDDLSLFLGLDWLPCLQNELPETESVANGAEAVAQQHRPHQQTQVAHQIALPSEDAATILVDPTVTTISSCSSSTASSPLSLQSHCELISSNSATSSAYSSAATSPSTSSSSPSCDTNSTLVCNPTARQSNHDCNNASAIKSAKKKPVRSRGTSLLAQPSPKTAHTIVAQAILSQPHLNSHSLANSNHSHVISMAATAASMVAPQTQTTVTTLPIKANSTHHVPRLLASTTTSAATRNVPILKLSTATSLASATKLLTYSNTCPGIITNKRNVRVTPQIIKATTIPATTGIATNNELLLTTTQNHVSFFQAHQHLSRQEYASRLCVRMEHNYALASS